MGGVLAPSRSEAPAEKPVPFPSPEPDAAMPSAAAGAIAADALSAARGAVAPALLCRDLTFRYASEGEPVLDGVSLSVRRGEAVLVMGASGSGKSTLAYCLAGLYPEYAGEVSGTVEVEGEPVASLRPQARSWAVSILFQNPDNQFCMDTVEREVLFALENVDWQGDLAARAHELLAQVGIEGYAGSPIRSLSGGTKQKLALATALATGARALVLDEPFANLDPLSCRQLAELLRRLNGQGVTLVVVDHKPGWWLPFVSRVVLMERSGDLDARSFPPARLPELAGELGRRGLFCGSGWLRGYEPPDVAAGAEPVLRARGLSVAHGGKPVLQGVSLDLARGSVTSIVGACGSGKSSLLTALAGASRFRGELAAPARVGLVFQNPRFQFLALTVLDEVLVSLRAAEPGAEDAGLRLRAAALLREFGLEGRAGASPYELSQGQQRRLALLAMLAARCDLLLLDEPTYAQDERATRFILDLLLGRVREGLTVLLATHDVELACAVSNEVLLAEDGRLLPLAGEGLRSYVAERKEPACGR